MTIYIVTYYDNSGCMWSYVYENLDKATKRVHRLQKQFDWPTEESEYRREEWKGGGIEAKDFIVEQSCTTMVKVWEWEDAGQCIRILGKKVIK